MQVAVTILVENTTPMPNLIGEYGFACLVAVDDCQILFDTGSSTAIFNNSRELGINLERIPEVFISHGHYDHTGGLLQLLKQYGPKKVYGHPRFLLPKLLPLRQGGFKPIGTPASREELLQAGAQLIAVDRFTAIHPGVYISGEIPRTNDFEDTGGNFQVEIDGDIREDRLDDDMAMIINHPRGLIIISGCAHAGMINTIDYAVQMTGVKQIQAYIGGTHLMTASADRLTQTVKSLKENRPEKVIVAHCTGFYAGARLYNDLGETVIKGETGMTFKF